MRTYTCIALLLAFAVSAYANTTASSAGTKCYVCSGIGGTCDDEYAGSSDHEQDCSATGYTDDGGCSKTKNKTKLLGTWVTTIARTCGQSYDNGQCAQGDRVSLNVLGIKSDTWSCSCEGELCNSGSQLALSSALIVSALAKYLL